MRRRKHRGKKNRNDKTLTIGQIERRFDQWLEKRQLLAEAFLLGKNKYGNADIVPMVAHEREAVQ